MSGPLADRIDMHVAVGPVALRDLSSPVQGETTAVISERVAAARAIQTKRFRRLKGVNCNAHAPGRWIDAYGSIEDGARSLLQRAAESLSLSARGYHRVLKVARTIADIDGAASVAEPHVAEAIRYRPSAGHA
jgi:magnesium chelatase family protein